MKNRICLKNYLLLPNLITSLKFISIPLMIYYGAVKNNIMFLVFFAAGWIIDSVDGIVARTLKMETRIGHLLDSYTDQVNFVAAFLLLIYIFGNFYSHNLHIIIIYLALNIISKIISLMKFGRLLALHLLSQKIGVQVFSLFIIFSLFYNQILYFWYDLLLVFSIIVGVEELSVIICQRYPDESVLSFFSMRHRKVYLPIKKEHNK
ncbi:MAG: CDP-alcohol phosphatidyltransferase family protein [archaeon]